jgi:urease accessory protein UreE
VDGMADDIERLTAEIADLRRQLDAAHQRRIRLDTIRWLADCLGLDNHATIAEITIRSSEVIVVRHRTPVVLCEHGGEMHVATVAERIEVNP